MAEVTVLDKKLVTSKFSVINKDWAAGSGPAVPIDNEFVMHNGKHTHVVHSNDFRASPKIRKMFDEGIVNITDHVIRCHNSNDPVTNINIELNYDTGMVTMYNNGVGIDVAIAPDSETVYKKKMYYPTIYFNELYQGSNHQKESKNTIGGTNGIGAKIINWLSLYFCLEVYDRKTKKYFRQSWERDSIETEDADAKITGPSVMDWDMPSGMCKITFVPDWNMINEGVKDGVNEGASNSNVKEAIKDHFNWFISRFAQAIAGLGKYGENVNACVRCIAGTTHTDISCNDFINNVDLKHPVVCFDTFTLTSVLREDIDIACFWGPDMKATVGKAGSILNSIVVHEGTHINSIHKTFIDRMLSKIKESLSVNEAKLATDSATAYAELLASHLYMHITMRYDNIKWESQVKTKCTIRELFLNKYEFIIPEKSFKYAREIFVSHINRVKAKPKKTTELEKKQRSCIIGDIEDKYKTSGKYRASVETKNATLVLVEGDSAMSQVLTGLSAVQNNRYIGLLSLGGVIVNTRKEVTMTETGDVMNASDKLAKNELNMLLDHLIKDDPATSRYQRVIVCVDQDLDGKGNILGLVVNHFTIAYPKRMATDPTFLRWFSTPIVRVIESGGNEYTFESIQAFETWRKDRRIASSTVISYLKGLGSHSAKQAKKIFSQISNAYSIVMDDEAASTLNIYYGSNSNLRKKELSSGLEIREATPVNNEIKITELAKTEIYAYQLDNISRKIASMMDGQNQSGKKVLNGIIDFFGADSKKEIKVSQLAGTISATQSYHHGEESLNKTITGKGLICPNGKQLPLITPHSNFGSRTGGDAAAARYIKCSKGPFTDYIFRKEDYDCLKFNFGDGGERIEPVDFMPIVPMHILESMQIPATGWKIVVYARDAIEVIDYMLMCINMKANPNPGVEFSPYQYNRNEKKWFGSITTENDKEVSYGKFEINHRDESVTITELPLGVFTKKYITDIKDMLLPTVLKGAKSLTDLIKLRTDAVKNKVTAKLPNLNGLNPGDATTWLKHPLVVDFCDTSADNVINIKVTFVKGVLKHLDVKDVVQYLRLQKYLTPNLNFIDGNKVVECKSYGEAFAYWYHKRRGFYEVRLIKRYEVLYYKKLMFENILQFLNTWKGIAGNERVTPERFDRLLQENGFKKFDRSKLMSKHVFEEDLEEAFCGSTASWEYLKSITVYEMDSTKKYKTVVETIAELERLMDEIKREVEMPEYKYPGCKMWKEELLELKNVINTTVLV